MFSGIISTVMGFLTGGNIAIGIAGAVVLYLLKRIKNATIKGAVKKLFYGLGVTVTLGAAKWKFTAKLWNVTIEAYFIDLIDNIIVGALEGFIEGLKSDNK